MLAGVRAVGCFVLDTVTLATVTIPCSSVVSVLFIHAGGRAEVQR
jgi:hypothetical protein